MEIGKRIRVSDPMGGGTHYGRIRNIVKDMFDGSVLYVVEVEGKEKTYKEESLLPLKKDQQKVKRQ